LPRFCICGCGKELLTADGFTDYSRKRRFATQLCYKRDKAQQLRDARRKATKDGRCPLCHQKIPGGRKNEKGVRHGK